MTAPILALDLDGAAASIGISRRMVEVLIEKKELAVCRVGRLPRIKVKDIEAYLDRNRIKTDAELEAEANLRPRKRA